MTAGVFPNLIDGNVSYFVVSILLAIFVSRLSYSGRSAVLIAVTVGFYSVQGLAAVASLALCALTCLYCRKRLLGEKDDPRRRRLYFASVFVVMLPLLSYKYIAPALIAFNPELGLAVAPKIPPGVSFYTFQAIGLMTEVFWGTMVVTALDSLGFLLFFPNLLAGPLCDPRFFIKKLKSSTSSPLTVLELQVCFARIFFGLFKKYAVAENIAAYSSNGFQAAGVYPGVTVVASILLYYLQVYADFSGYSDIAVGLAGLFRIPLPENFQRPYLALNVTDFWRRWHITLGWWATRYVFMPLNFKWRVHPSGLYAATFATFLLIGVWHGAGLNFVVYGALHATAVCLDLATGRAWSKPIVTARWPAYCISLCRTVSCFVFVSFTLVFFRSGSLSEALRILRLATKFSAGGLHIFDKAIFATIVVCVTFMFLVEALVPAYHKSKSPWRSDLWWPRLAPVFVLATVLCGVLSGQSFVYFNF